MITGLSYIFTTSYSGELFNSLSSIPFYSYAWGIYQILEVNYMYIFILHETNVEYGYLFYHLFIIKQKGKGKEIKIIVNCKVSRYLSKWSAEHNSGDLMHPQYIRRKITFYPVDRIITQWPFFVSFIGIWTSYWTLGCWIEAQLFSDVESCSRNFDFFLIFNQKCFALNRKCIQWLVISEKGITTWGKMK